MEAPAKTGMKMTLGQGQNPHVKWVGEKKTDKFLKDSGNANTGGVGTSAEWYEALDLSQEVLVWAGKFTSNEGYGSESES